MIFENGFGAKLARVYSGLGWVEGGYGVDDRVGD